MVFAFLRDQAGGMTENPTGTSLETSTDPSPSDDPHEGPRVSRDEIRDLGRLRRTVDDRKVAGVAGGLARHLDIDPAILRIAFVVLALFGGVGLLIYGALWLLVPEEGSDSALINLDERSRGAAIIGVVILAALALVADSAGVLWFPWPLAVGVLVVWLVVLNLRSARNRRRSAVSLTKTGDPGASSTPYPPHAPAQPWLGAVAPRPRNPRRRGPILFWFTLALVALGLGVLGLLDVGGLAVADSVYPAVAVALIGVMLLVGAFYGRAGGLILLGLAATLALVGATVTEHWDSDRRLETPSTASEVDARYWIPAGELTLDLTGITDLAALDDRRVTVEGGVGHLEILLPEGLSSEVEAAVHGTGNISLFGEDNGGIDVTANKSQVRARDVATLRIDTNLGVGEIEVSYP